MNIVSRRATLERVLSLARSQQPELDIRRELWELLDEERRAASREMWMLAAGAAVLMGGSFTLTPAVLSQLTERAALRVQEDGAAGTVTLEWTPDASLAQFLLSTLERHTPPDGTAPTFPPANLAEPDDVARVRVCEAFRRLVATHYDTELQQRGHAWMVSVVGELVAMAVGIELAAYNERAAATGEPTLSVSTRAGRLREHLEPRILHYQMAAESRASNGNGDDPGPAVPSTRVM